MVSFVFRLILGSLLVALPAFAEDGGIVDASGRLINSAGVVGATANRKTADDLFKQAMEYEDAAWKTFPPNLGLLAKASATAQSGFQADDQSRQMAQVSMHGIDSGLKGGDLNLAKYGAEENKLRELASTSSQYRGEVSRRMSAYKVQVSADGKNFETMIGSFPMDLPLSVMEKGFKIGARMFGMSTDGISEGLQSAVATRDAIAARNSAEAQRLLAAMGAGGGTALAAAAEALAVQEPGAKAERQVAGLPANSGLGVQAIGNMSDDDIDAKARMLRQSQNEIRRKMGLAALKEREPMGSANQDIFQMVHLRYQSLRNDEVFIESHHIVDNN